MTNSIHSACESDVFIFFVFHLKTDILYLSPQALIKMGITGSNNRVWKEFIALMTPASKSTFIIFGDRKEH
jgi:hypothetical protein